MMDSANRTRLLTAVALAALALPATLQAQTALPSPAETTEGLDGDIIVTANKRAERVLDVALSITAVTGDQLNEKRLIDIQDLATRVPGFSFSRGGAAGSQGVGQRIIIRGLNTGSTNATVASVIDDIPLTASAASSAAGDFAADFDPYDLDRIEVLKGPQGTLYGASSLGGLVKYVTKLPDLTQGRAGFDVGVTNLRRGDTGAYGKLVINAPIVSDVAALRSSLYYEYTPGWVSNNLGGNPRTNTVRRYGGRASLLVQPTPDLSIRGTIVVQNRDAGGNDSIEVRGYTDPANEYAPLNGYNKNTYLDEPSTARSEIYAANVDYDLGKLRLQSITSYGRQVTSYVFDSPLYQPLSGPFFGRPNTTLGSESVNSVEKFNQELRLASDNEAAATGQGLEYQAGLFYTRETTESTNDYLTRDATTRQLVITPASVAATPPGTPQVFLGRIRTKYREYAGYLDFTYHFSPQFDIEVGGRLFRNEQSFTQETGGALFSPATFQVVGTSQSTETRATFAVAPRFHVTPDLIVYARVASGYRPGGPNLTLPPATLPGDTPGTAASSFGADRTINYEAGVKGTVAGNLLSFDVAGFYIDWTDIQVATTFARGLTGYPVTINAGKATSKGVEWNVTLRPVRGLSLGVLGAYTEATLSAAIPQIGGSGGSQLPFVPKWTTTATADYSIPLSDGINATIGGAYVRVGDRRTSYGFIPARSYLPIPSYETWSAQAGLSFGGYSVQVYGKNLTDERGIVNYERGAAIFGVSLPGSISIIRPREIGIRLSGSF